MADPDDAGPARGSAHGGTATEAFAPLQHPFSLLRHRLERALAALGLRRPSIRPAAGLAASETAGSITAHGGMMLDDAGTWARLVAIRIPASDNAPPVLTCTLTLYAADGNVVSSATATRRRS